MEKILTIFVSMMIMISCSTPVEKQQKFEIEAPLNDWKSEFEQTLNLLGHRNWIVVADAAYPQQSNLAIQTIYIDANQLEVVEFVSKTIEKAKHVDANIFIDKEMAFVPEEHAKGIEAYRTDLDLILKGKNVNTKLHNDIIRELDVSAELFNVFIIKTNLAIPYTSVFFQLECGYWNSEAEETLRNDLSDESDE